MLVYCQFSNTDNFIIKFGVFWNLQAFSILLKLKEAIVLFYTKRNETLRYNLKFLFKLNDNEKKQFLNVIEINLAIHFFSLNTMQVEITVIYVSIYLCMYIYVHNASERNDFLRDG